MYRSGKAAQRLLPLTPLLQTGDRHRMMIDDVRSLVSNSIIVTMMTLHYFREVFLLADPQVPHPRAAAMRGGRTEILSRPAPASSHRGEGRKFEDCDY